MNTEDDFATYGGVPGDGLRERTMAWLISFLIKRCRICGRVMTGGVCPKCGGHHE